MDQKGTTFDHDLHVVKTISLYKLIYALLLLICFKLVMKSMKLCKFQNLFSFLKKYLWNVKNFKLT